MQGTQKIVMALSYHLLFFVNCTQNHAITSKNKRNDKRFNNQLFITIVTGHLFEASVIYAKYTKMSGAQDFLLS